MLSVLRSSSLLAALVLLASCGEANTRSKVSAEFIGMKGDRFCFIREDPGDFRSYRTGCFVAGDGLVDGVLQVGDCVDVRLPVIWRAPNQDATLVRVLDRECDIGRKFVARLTEQLMSSENPTGHGSTTTAEDFNPRQELGES